MVQGGLARRYGKALLDSAPGGDRARIYDELRAFDGWVRGTPELREVLLSPAFQPAEREAVLAKVLGRAEFHELTGRFLRLLLEARRLPALTAILTEFRRRADVEEGVLRAKVETAAPVAPEQLAKLRDVLARATGRRVETETAVEPALLGGMRLKVGDMVYDGTLEHRLERLKETLRG